MIDIKNKLFFFKNNKKINFILVLFISVASLGIYHFIRYENLDSKLKKISIEFNQKAIESKPILYIFSGAETKINFKNVFNFVKSESGAYEIDINDSIDVRKFRIYFRKKKEGQVLSNLKITTNTTTIVRDFREIEEFSKIHINSLSSHELSFSSSGDYAYLESPKILIYPKDYQLYWLMGFLVLLLAILLYLILRTSSISEKLVDIIKINPSIFLFLISIFLPHPAFNITLILALIINIRKVKLSNIKKNNIAQAIILFFLIYLVNNLFITEESFREMRTVERFIPLLLIPLLLTAQIDIKHLSCFPICALFLGLFFIGTSISDILMLKSITYFSFENFTKYLHPVYFSYLLFFSIIYLQKEEKSRIKYLFQTVLLIFLIFSGSKLIVLITLLGLLFFSIKNYKLVFLIVFPILMFSIFKPIQERFKEVMNLEDISILEERHIDNEYDKRINGLTLRLILWRETIKTMDKWQDFIFGKGVGRVNEKRLNDNILGLGLFRFDRFNPHNQYVDTFWRTGILGLIILLFIPFLSIFKGIREKDKLLIIFGLFMLFCMLTESIFGRVRGIYFFSTILIILSNNYISNENCNSRDKRSTE